jgi:hypothetical protein
MMLEASGGKVCPKEVKWVRCLLAPDLKVRHSKSFREMIEEERYERNKLKHG